MDSPGGSPTLFAALVREFPLLRLALHFAQGLLQASDDDDGLEASTGALLGLLALPGVFVSLSLFDKYSSLMRFFRNQRLSDHLVISLPDKYFFIVFAMVVTGLITIWKWDRILPVRQDWINLAPLPLTARKILLANLMAIVSVAALFAIDVNAASSILFPFIVMAEARQLSDVFAFMAVHALVVITASVFTFFAVLFVLGAMMAVLPAAMLARVSMAVRLALVAVFVAMLGSSFGVPSAVRDLPVGEATIWRWVPPVWFLGWYQSLQDRGAGFLAEVAPWSWRATLMVATGAAIAYGVSYQRLFLRLPETLGLASAQRRESWPWLRALLERWLWRTPFERAAGIFALRALLRSETHLLVVMAFLAMGAVAAAQAALAASARPVYELPGRTWLSVPLMLTWFLLCGFRFVLDLPAPVAANWVFQFVLTPGPQAVSRLARKLILAVWFALVVLPSAMLFTWGWGAGVALGQSLFLITSGCLLTEALVTGYRKIPFTCTRAPFQSHGPVVFLLFWVGFAVFVFAGSGIERWMFDQPLRFAWLLALIAAGVYALREWHDGMPDIDHDIIYRDLGVKAMERMDLSATGQ